MCTEVACRTCSVSLRNARSFNMWFVSLLAMRGRVFDSVGGDDDDGGCALGMTCKLRWCSNNRLNCGRPSPSHFVTRPGIVKRHLLAHIRTIC
uniref:HDC13912 n=1 Tax=Drosophila melanogaster TaxID=7227 RepID=Q6IJZ7_DROME|nr:TPA_inf: HDC13912 [Drosophila melanogaster]